MRQQHPQTRSHHSVHIQSVSMILLMHMADICAQDVVMLITFNNRSIHHLIRQIEHEIDQFSFNTQEHN